MARSAALNPASMPFFPGSVRLNEDDVAFASKYHTRALRSDDVQRTSVSSVSISPSEYRTARSSPSPSQEEMTFRSPFDALRRSPSCHQEANRSYPPIETRVSREASMSGSLAVLPEGEDNAATPGPNGPDHSASFFQNHQHGKERYAPPPLHHNGNSFIPPLSSSPVSSSGSHFNAADQAQSSFEAQIKASPMIHDVLDRLIRCEYTTREIQQSLVDLNRKVNVLVERSLANNPPPSQQPEFNDPFSANQLRRGSYTPISGSNLGPRPSIGNIAPNQNPPVDMATISQRLNTLTSSVGQLLSLQTQQNQATAPPLPPIAGLSNGGFMGPKSQAPPGLDFIPQSVPNSSLLGRGLPTRPDMRPSPRLPNPPMRTWSTGNIELPMRPPENIGRMDNVLGFRPPDSNSGRPDGFPRDKRRSVTSLMRRDSASTLATSDDAGSTREVGPVVTKWEQLVLDPDLYTSLNKFGVGPPNKIQQRALPFLLRGADIIAQAPPTQERIAAYVIPALQVALTHRGAAGPVVFLIATTVDQAKQAHRMIRDLGSHIGIRSAEIVGGMETFADEFLPTMSLKPQVVCATPQKLHAYLTTPSGLSGSDVRFLVLDEVDQLIARNMHEFVFNIVKLIPAARNRPPPSSDSPSGSTAGPSINDSPVIGPARKMSAIGTPIQRTDSSQGSASPPPEEKRHASPIERQTALFSNTVPQDVLNLATIIQLKDPARVLVRRDGTVTQVETSPNFRGLRQFYLYLAFTAGGGRSDSVEGGLGIIGSGRSASTAETVQAREWKLEALIDILEDVEISQAIVHVGGVSALDAVVYKLASRGFEAIPLHGDMSSATKLSALSKFKSSPSVVMRQSAVKVLVIYDVHVQDVNQIPLIVNYDLPKAVEEYTHRTAPAVAPNSYTRGGVIVNFVTATGGDVEMLRSIECFHKIKCPEVPISLRDVV